LIGNLGDNVLAGLIFSCSIYEAEIFDFLSKSEVSVLITMMAGTPRRQRKQRVVKTAKSLKTVLSITVPKSRISQSEALFTVMIFYDIKSLT